MTAVSDETGREPMMLYLDRSEVRSILIGQPDECLHITESVLAEIDALPIFTKDDVAAALSAAPVAQEPVAYRYRSSIDPDWIYHDERLPPHDMAWQDEGLEEQGLYRSTPAGVGADGIARVFARWKKSKNLHESLAAQSIEKELLALLSRGAGESK